MAEAQLVADGAQPDHAYLTVTREPDGRYCVVYQHGGVSRRSYTSSLEQVIRQARRAGGIPINTDDGALRQRCVDESLTLL
ncbi:hypothetical protein EKD04_015025 [Chloroflexales bacterium ZM16-3]|nr:hypothetical protein [Chloroflexales bacterium ZM16-3]